MTEIGRRLGRNKSSVSRELKRNGNRDGSYNPWRGTSLYRYRRKASVRKPRIDDPEAGLYVREHLGKDFMWPPECITERLKMERTNTKLSWNTIYSAGMYALVKLYETGPCFFLTSEIVPNLNAAIKECLVPPSGCSHFIFSYASSTK
jgi:IS30 family transposase